MKDDPEAVLGVQAPSLEAERDSTLWLWSLLAPAIGCAPGLAIGLLSPPNENDWLGVRVLLPAALGLALGCIASIGLSMLSVSRQERRCVVSFIASFPCAVGIVWTVGLILRNLIH